MATRPDSSTAPDSPPGSARGALTVAEGSGLAAGLCAAALAGFDPVWAVVPLGLWLTACIAAPFLPRYGFFLPVISRDKTGPAAVALTFDDGPDRLATPPLLELLARSGARATFFVTGRRAAVQPELIGAILNQGHRIGNHSYNHNAMLAFGPHSALRRDIQATQAVLRRCGVVPHAYRPPVGITHPTLGPVLRDMGLYAVNFSCRGRDRGNWRIEGLAARILRQVRPGDIIAMHDIRPGKGQPVDRWLREVEKVLEGLERKGLKIVPLEHFTGRPVMTIVDV